LQDAAGPLGQAAAGLRVTARPLTETLRAVPPFATSARPPLQAVTGIAPSLWRLRARAEPVVRRVERAAGELGSFAHSLRPVKVPGVAVPGAKVPQVSLPHVDVPPINHPAPDSRGADQLKSLLDFVLG